MMNRFCPLAREKYTHFAAAAAPSFCKKEKKFCQVQLFFLLRLHEKRLPNNVWGEIFPARVLAMKWEIVLQSLYYYIGCWMALYYYVCVALICIVS